MSPMVVRGVVSRIQILTFSLTSLSTVFQGFLVFGTTHRIQENHHDSVLKPAAQTTKIYIINIFKYWYVRFDRTFVMFLKYDRLDIQSESTQDVYYED